MYTLARSHSHWTLQFSSAVLVHQLGALYPPVGDPARPNQDPVVRLAGEIARVAHRAIVFPLGASELQSEPDARGEVRGAHVPHGAHLVGAGEEDLRALAQPRAPLHARRGRAAPAAPQGRPGPAHGRDGQTDAGPARLPAHTPAAGSPSSR